jgi:hypothetical protein
MTFIKMVNTPTIIIECPECGEKYLLPFNDKIRSSEAIIYTDGYYSDPINWRTPGIIGCTTCELGFFPSKGKLVAQPNPDEFIKKWAHLPKAIPPKAGSMAMELRIRKTMDLFTEKTLRKEFWYAGNHYPDGLKLNGQNEKFRKFWIESLQCFESILDENIEDERILKAEANRNLGNYEKCINLLIHSEQRIVSQKIIEQARVGNNAPVALLNN